jgi:cation diffusion facilitator family transporter
VTGGVDTHKDTHTAAVLDATGRLLGHRQFPTTPAGYGLLLAWLRSHGELDKVGIDPVMAHWPRAGAPVEVRRSGRGDMAADGSTRAVMTALGANVGIGVAKFIAAAITGSASMLAEGVHSVADSGNQVLLLIGGRHARQAPSALHQFGYARVRYLYAFLVAIVLFTLGGLYALYEGYHKLTDPHPLSSPLIAVVVLLIAFVLEGYALRTAVREANRTRGTRSWLQFVRRARAPELPVLLLEDSGALVGLSLALLGVGLSVLTGNGAFDGIATLCIGVLLAAIAVLLARETTSLIIGEAAVPEQANKIYAALQSTPGVEQVIHLRTVHLGPDDLLVAGKIGIAADADGEDIAATINDAEARVRQVVPSARIIYLEPDIYQPDDNTVEQPVRPPNASP